MKKTFYILLLFISLKAFAQVAPPPPAYPTQQNKVLIDKLVETVGFKGYILNYCIDRIDLAGRLEKWDENKKRKL